MAAGESITTAVLMKQAGTAYYLNTFQIDGSSVTPEWQGGAAPSAGNTKTVSTLTHLRLLKQQMLRLLF